MRSKESTTRQANQNIQLLIDRKISETSLNPPGVFEAKIENTAEFILEKREKPSDIEQEATDHDLENHESLNFEGSSPL